MASLTTAIEPKAARIAGEAGRIASVDILRGLAVALMVAANSAGELLAEPHPFALRLAGSFAAPIFLTLTGMMVARAAESRRRGIRYFAGRGALLLALGMAVDVGLEGWLPFVGFDILYLLGISLPLAYGLARAPLAARWAVPAAIFAMTPALQSALGYRLDMPIVPRDTPIGEWAGLLPDAARRLAIDGWFPLFPWLGFALLGVPLDARRHREAGPEPRDTPIGLFVLALGAAIWWLDPGPMVTRKGYSELFYPAPTGFVITSVGLIVVLLPMAGPWSKRAEGWALQQFGRCSLFLYLAHLVILNELGRSFFRDAPFDLFLVIYAGLLVLLWLLAAAMNRLKRAFRDRGHPVPDLLAFLIGR